MASCCLTIVVVIPDTVVIIIVIVAAIVSPLNSSQTAFAIIQSGFPLNNLK